MPLSTDLFDYNLPARLIAQTPVAKRDGSRLLVVERKTRLLSHRKFSDLPELLRAGDTLFRNNATVIPARLFATRPTGARVECVLIRRIDSAKPRIDGSRPPVGQEYPAELWECLVKPGRRLAVGSTFGHAEGSLAGQVVAKEANGVARVRFSTRSGEAVISVANRVGVMPLPPYIERRDDSHQEHDRERYQTVYANPAQAVAAAAPTAGLHFTPELLEKITAQGVRIADMTLHVGLGTFRPLSTSTVEEHPIHRELYEISPETQRQLFAPPTGRRIAVGTTSVRAIEDFLSQHDAPTDKSVTAEAEVFIWPPYAFKGVDALITNFHLPRSTLLCLVAAFLDPGSTEGIEWLKKIYAEAIAKEYRFLSYGDAMLIL